MRAAAGGTPSPGHYSGATEMKPQARPLLVAAPQTTPRHGLSRSPWPPREKKNRKKKTTTHRPLFPPPLPEAGQGSRSPGKGGPNMYFPKRTGTPGGKAQSEGAHPARPAWPGFRGAAARGGGDAGRAPGPAGTR